MKQEIKQGDRVRVSIDTPLLYIEGRTDWEAVESTVEKIDGDAAEIRYLDEDIDEFDYTVVPTKYLIKVDAETKEAKFKVGDRVRVKGCGYEPNLHKGDIGEILDTNDKEQCFVLFKKSQAWIYTDCLELYTEPTEQTEAKKTKKKGDTLTFPIAFDLTDSYWNAYTADLAKEIVLKTVNSASDRRTSAIAEYAVSVAKAVVEGLKRK